MFKLNTIPDALPPQYEIRKYFEIQKFTFNYLGIEVTSEKRTIFQPILIWIPMLFLVALCVFMLLYAIECRNDMNLVTDIVAPFWQALLALIKILCFLWNRRKIVKLVRNIWLWNLEGNIFISLFQLNY